MGLTVAHNCAWFSLISFTIHSCDMSACVEDCDCEGYNCKSSNCVSDCEGVDLTICKDHCDCDTNDGSVACDMPACTKDCRCDGGGCAMPICQNWCKCFGGDCTSSTATQNYPGAPSDGSIPSWCANVDPERIPYVAECLTDKLPAWCAEILGFIDFAPTPINQIARHSGLTMAKISAMLIRMEMQGLVKTCAGGYIRLR